MTANETRLLKIFAVALLAAAFVPLAFSSIERIRAAETGIRSYAANIEKLSDSGIDGEAARKRIAELRAKLGGGDAAEELRSFPEFAVDVRSALGRRGIEPARYQVVGAGKDAAIEFILQCDPKRFFEFLRDVRQEHRAWSVPYVALRAEEAVNRLNVTIRITYAR